MTARVCSRSLVSCGSRVDARGEDRLHRRRNLEITDGLGELHDSIADQRSLIEQDLHRFFHEERIAFGFLNNYALERRQVGLSPSSPESISSAGSLPSGSRRSCV